MKKYNNQQCDRIVCNVVSNINNCIMMKTYKKFEVESMNAPMGSYVAGCPANNKGSNQECQWCERAK